MPLSNPFFEVISYRSSVNLMLPAKRLCITIKSTIVFYGSRIGFLVFNKHLLFGHSAYVLTTRLWPSTVPRSEAWPCGLRSQRRLQESQVSNSREQVMWRQVSILSKGLATFLVLKCPSSDYASVVSTNNSSHKESHSS